MPNHLRVGTIAVLLTTAAAAPPAERIVTGDGVATVTVAGVTRRMRIDPAAAAMPMIDQDCASAAGLKGGMFGFVFGIGPERVTGVTGVTRIDYGHGPQKQRIG